MDILDQAEVDALLSAVDAGDIAEEDDLAPPQAAAPEARPTRATPAAPPPVELDVRDYDFKRPERVSKDQMRSLKSLHEGFARNMGASLSGFLRTIIEVQVSTIEQLTFS